MTVLVHLAALLFLATLSLKFVAMAAPLPDDRIALLSDVDAWQCLPRAEQGSGQRLPNWARAVAVHLPRTAAAMLELDLAQRTKSPLDPILRAKMRFVIARANGSAYSVAYALADLDRVGGNSEIKALIGDPADWPEADRGALEFARLLTVAAPSIDDALFASLREHFGDKQVAAMVLLVAYGNFQDRLALGLQLPVESEGPLPPLEVAFAPDAFQATAILPTQQTLSPPAASGETIVERDPEWSTLSYETLQSQLELQRDRSSRLPIPRWDDIKQNLPPAFAAHPTRILWSLVCFGYAPELAVPWSVATRTMWAEKPQDRVFEESLFWIQTRSVGCNYCMGHCEMLLQLAGLDGSAVGERIRRLASDDWSVFPPAEQRAFAFARKLSRRPWDVSLADYRTLEADLGPDRAMPTFWWLCRGLYMTRISDGFQFPLERDNVFTDYDTSHAADRPAEPGDAS